MPIPWMYCSPKPSAAAGAVDSFTSPPNPPPASFTDEVPCSSEASSMKYEGIIEKSVMPSIGLLMRMPFHVTCVCEGPVPRNDTVESVARPYCLTKIDELKVSTSAIDRAMFSFRTTESNFVSCTPMLFIGRWPHTGTSRMATTPFSRHAAAPVSLADWSDCARSSAGSNRNANNMTLFFISFRYFQQNAPGVTPT